MSYIVFSDLDGTLLDHYDYSFSAAIEAIRTLQQRNIPIVLNTSKTKAETAVILAQMQLDDAFIVENGAAAFLPKSHFSTPPSGCYSTGEFWCYEFVKPMPQWRELLRQFALQTPTCFSSFSTMPLQQLIELTSLTPEQAEAAKARGYAEVLHWTGSDSQLSSLHKFAEENGAKVHIGGRFVHFGGESDKGRAMQWVTARYQELEGELLQTIALGDGQNDAPMLALADFPVVIRSPKNPAPNLSTEKSIRTSELYGPHGWREEIERFF